MTVVASRLQRFVKEGVYSMELEGHEGNSAPLMLHYTASVLHTLPQIINHYFPATSISQKSYGTKVDLRVSLRTVQPHARSFFLASLRDRQGKQVPSAHRQHWVARLPQSHVRVLHQPKLEPVQRG
jgi:hypothetical protein